MCKIGASADRYCVLTAEAYLNHCGVVDNSVAFTDRIAVNLKVFNCLQYKDIYTLSVHTQTLL